MEQHVKKVFLVLFQAPVKLNKLGVTVSPKRINKALDLLGEDFDLQVISTLLTILKNVLNLCEKVVSLRREKRNCSDWLQQVQM